MRVQSKGIHYEIETVKKELENIHINVDDFKQYETMKHHEMLMNKAKPKQRKRYAMMVHEMKKSLHENVIKNIELRKSKQNEIKKLEQNKVDAENYITETCTWQENILIQTKYLTRNENNELCRLSWEEPVPVLMKVMPF